MSDAIVRSNGWEDAVNPTLVPSGMDALNVALLVPEVKRATWAELVGARTEHSGSPGRLADYQRQFESTGRGRTVDIRHSS